MITFTVNKANVYDEVAKTTAYTGSKTDAEGAYDKMFTTDEDRYMLERFWSETCGIATGRLKNYVSKVSTHSVDHSVDLGENYVVSLSLDENRFNVELAMSISESMFSFFVSAICAKWFKITSPELVEAYATESAAMLDDTIQKIVHKTKPTR